MGRGGNRKKRLRDAAAATSAGAAPNQDVREGKKAAWQTVDLNSNDNTFIRYYGPEGINLLEMVGRDAKAEWPKMLVALRTPLPSTFRVSPCGNFTKRTVRSLNQLVANILQNTSFPLKDAETSEIIAEGPPKPIGQWCPEAWTSGTFRSGLKSLGPFRDMHRFLVRASETGAISRQELVSMIPAILLNVQPGNWVLDMCAAPGSKSLQILEVLDRDKNGGVLIANDVDSRRAYMLTKRTRNLKSASLVIATHDATQFPVHRHPDGTPLFDRILCDVPCSGDGTVRKNVLLWNTLKVRDGAALHPTQLRIGAKAVQCLKVGGNFVYSTCSFNPIEDEAVVCELLKMYPGEIELVATERELPGLIRAPGMSKPWKVPVQRPEDDMIRFFSTFAEFEAWNNSLEKPLGPGTIRPSMFPPENLAQLGMEKCLRLLPHDQDSGGFFVAVFRKVKDVIAERKSAAANQSSSAPSTTTSTTPVVVGEGGEVDQPNAEEGKDKKPQYQRKAPRSNKNDVWYEEISDEAWESIQNEWGIVGLSKRTFQVRMDNRTPPANAESKKFPAKVSWLNEDLLRLFEIAEEKPSSLHIVHAGVLALQRGRGNTYRIVNDYASMFLPNVTKRVVEIGLNDLKGVYEQLFAKGHIVAKQNVEERELDAAAEGGEDAQGEEEEEDEEGVVKQKPVKEEKKQGGDLFEAIIPASALPESQKSNLATLNEGGLLVRLNPQDQAKFADEIGGLFALAAWWGSKTFVRFMVDKNELVELLVQLKEANLF